MHAIIERTANFVCKQGAQFEIMLKAKQARNSQFDFLRFDHYLNPYYKFIQKAMKEGRYPVLAGSKSDEKQSTWAERAPGRLGSTRGVCPGTLQCVQDPAAEAEGLSCCSPARGARSPRYAEKMHLSQHLCGRTRRHRGRCRRSVTVRTAVCLPFGWDVTEKAGLPRTRCPGPSLGDTCPQSDMAHFIVSALSCCSYNSI